jgi:hypothetical protein
MDYLDKMDSMDNVNIVDIPNQKDYLDHGKLDSFAYICKQQQAIMHK